MPNTENIEAKLAAYVDGELDAVERAEIEQHLVQNPQHRVLIEELRQQKVYLRALPHVNAPPDIAEAMAAQLERAALLGDVDMDIGGDGATHFSRWPQVRAIAAVILLTVGLAAVLYKVLPSPKPSAPRVAVVLPEPTRERPAPDESAVTESDRDSGVAGRASSAAGGAVLSDVDERETSVAAPHEVYLVIDTPDPIATNQQVVEYLDRVRCEYRQVPANEIAPGADALKDLTAANTNAVVPTTEPSSRPAVTSDSAIATSATSNAPELSPAAQMGRQASRGIGATTQAADDKAAQIAPSAIVAKMTHEEAAQFSAAMSQPQQRQAAQIVWPPAQLQQHSERKQQQMMKSAAKPASPEPAATTQAAAEHSQTPTTSSSVLMPGDTLHIRAREMRMPGVEPLDETQTLDAEGSLTIPGVGKVAAAGISVDQLSKQLDAQSAQRAKDSQSPPPELSWSIEKVQPTSVASPPVPTSAPATAPANEPTFAGPSTAPTAGMTAREEVVILLRSTSQAPMAPSTAPAPTQPISPATEPSTQPTPSLR